MIPIRSRISDSTPLLAEGCEVHGRSDLWIDLGFGKGEFLAGLAEIYPGIFFIGVEVRKEVAEKLVVIRTRFHLDGIWGILALCVKGKLGTSC